MVLGKAKKPIEIKKKVDNDLIKKKIEKLKYAIKIPAPINQFNTRLEEVDYKRISAFLKKYKPETKKEKKERLSKKNPKEGPKPKLIKYGLKHLVELIKSKRLSFLLIAADVEPITTVVFLPTLCKKMNISYGIVSSKESLGELVNLKKTAALGLEEVREEDKGEFEDIKKMCNSIFLDQYEKHISTVGGQITNKK